MTTQEIEAIRRRLEAATPGPWTFSVVVEQDVRYATGPQHAGGVGAPVEIKQKAYADGVLISTAPTDLRTLLAEVERLQLEASHYLANLGTAEILKSNWQRQKDQMRSALKGVVAACRFDCTPESNCGVCAIALKALAEVAE